MCHQWSNDRRKQQLSTPPPPAAVPFVSHLRKFAFFLAKTGDLPVGLRRRGKPPPAAKQAAGRALGGGRGARADRHRHRRSHRPAIQVGLIILASFFHDPRESA